MVANTYWARVSSKPLAMAFNVSRLFNVIMSGFTDSDRHPYSWVVAPTVRIPDTPPKARVSFAARSMARAGPNTNRAADRAPAGTCQNPVRV